MDIGYKVTEMFKEDLRLSSEVSKFMTIKEFIDNLDNKDISRIVNEHRDHYEEILKQSISHSTRSDMSRMLSIARPSEEEVYIKWRKDNYRHITVAPIIEFRRMLSRVLQSSFDLSTVKDHYPDLYELIYKLVFVSIYDPNAIVLDFPYNPNNPDLPLAVESRENENIKITTKHLVVSSVDITYKSDNILIYDTKQVKKIDKENYRIYLGLDKESYWLLIPYKEDKKIVYRPEPWYLHGLDRLPIASLPAMETGDVKESICWSAFEYLDEVVQAASSEQVAAIRSVNPKLIVDADIPCGDCNGEGWTHEGTKKTDCKKCNATGSLSVIGDFSTIKIKQKNNPIDKSSKDSISYLNAPVESLEYALKRVDYFMDKAQMALCTDPLEGTGNESSLAKNLRLEPKQDLLKMYGQMFSKMVSDLYNNRNELRVDGYDELVVSPPAYYETKSPELLREEIKLSLFTERAHKYMRYINLEFKGDAFMINVHKKALDYAPLFLYNEAEIDFAMGNLAYSDKDIIKRDRAIYTLTALLKDESNQKLDDKELFEKCDQFMIDMGFLSENEPTPLAVDQIE